jgi:hypothetical protein
MWQKIEQKITKLTQGLSLLESRVVDNVPALMLNIDITRAAHCICKLSFSQLSVFLGFFISKSNDARGVVKSLYYFQYS